MEEYNPIGNPHGIIPFLLPYKNAPPTPLDVPAQQQGAPPTQQDVHVPVQQQSVFTTEPDIHVRVQVPPNHEEGGISEVKALLDIWQTMRLRSYTGGKHV